MLCIRFCFVFFLLLAFIKCNKLPLNEKIRNKYQTYQYIKSYFSPLLIDYLYISIASICEPNNFQLFYFTIRVRLLMNFHNSQNTLFFLFQTQRAIAQTRQNYQYVPIMVERQHIHPYYNNSLFQFIPCMSTIFV